MKNILVLSDIHFPGTLNSFPIENIKSKLPKIDMVFGLGDYTSIQGLNYLYSFEKDVIAVSGNMDNSNLKSKLNSKEIIAVENINIGLIHGWGPPLGIREKIYKEFSNVNLICYGHTHSPYFGNINNVSFFNPGSLCGQNGTIGILTLNNGEINAEIVNI